MKTMTRLLQVCLITIIVTGAVVITGCTPEPVTATATVTTTTTQTETLPPETITATVTKTTTQLSQPTIPNQIALDVTVAEAYTMIQDNVDNPEFVILDVRTPGEYAEGYIEGAILIDKMSDTFITQIEALDRCVAYLVY